ncbi:putative toxin-antitoxin system toxin component, PIN family [Candidatus Parcubacteria bacterium]|nr:putative toxin-antitoxin system toxin component, PIN family [Candidatus Parcubacteria bacterium]
MRSTKSSTRLRIVVDTNVFVSAFIWGGRPKRVIKKWLGGKFILLLSPFLLSEIILVLKRFDFSQGDLQKIRHILENNSLKFLPEGKVKVCRDEKDNQVLDLCLAGQADFLVTGDKDLLTLKKFRRTQILSPKELLTN